MSKKLKPLARSQQRAFVLKTLKAQGGLCPLCEQPIDYKIPREAVLDHDHDTGECRGVLHRSCNGAEGKVANAAGRWGAKSMDYADIVPYLENLVEYLKRPGLGYEYPGHKTEEQKAEARRIRRNKLAAQRRAKQRAKEIGKK